MLFKKDELSKFNFISAWEFVLCFILMFLASVASYIYLPMFLKKALFGYTEFLNSHIFVLVLFLLSNGLNFYIVYYFCCKLKQKSLKDGLFFYTKPLKTYLISFIIGILMPICTLPIIFSFAPHEFYAMDLVKTKDGTIFLFLSALFAPVFEEVFYRGFIFPFFQSKLNSFWAVLITSVFFALAHFLNIGSAYVLLSLFFVYGLALSLIRYFTNSLIPPIITHFFHNSTLITCFLIVSAKQ